MHINPPWVTFDTSRSVLKCRRLLHQVILKINTKMLGNICDTWYINPFELHFHALRRNRDWIPEGHYFPTDIFTEELYAWMDSYSAHNCDKRFYVWEPAYLNSILANTRLFESYVQIKIIYHEMDWQSIDTCKTTQVRAG